MPQVDPEPTSAGAASRVLIGFRRWKAPVRRGSVFAGCDLPRLARKLKNVEPGVRAIVARYVDRRVMPAIVAESGSRSFNAPSELAGSLHQVAITWYRVSIPRPNFFVLGGDADRL